MDDNKSQSSSSPRRVNVADSADRLTVNEENATNSTGNEENVIKSTAKEENVVKSAENEEDVITLKGDVDNDVIKLTDIEENVINPTGNEENVIKSKFILKAFGAEAENYDYKAARPPGKTTNIVESVGHLIKSCLGCGVVAIHEGYMNCGLWTSLILNVFLGFGVAYCMYIIVKSARKVYGRVKVPSMSYPDIAEASLVAGPWDRMRRFGRIFRYLVDLTITIDLFGSCCVYQVVIARSIKQLVEGTEELTNDGHLPIRIYILALAIPCILICMITTLKYLAPFSIVADAVILTVAIATIYYGVEAASKPPTQFPAFKSAAGLFEFIGVCVFSVEGVGATLPIENHMTEPEKMPIVIILGMSIVISVVMVVGFFGYWGFGEESQSPITLNFPMSPFPIFLKVCMIIMVWVTFALNFWIPFNLVWHYISKKYDPEKYWIWERIYRTIFIIVITSIAVCFPNVSKFMGVLGAFCLSNMGFIFPAFIELSLDWKDPGLGFMKWRLIKAIFIIIFGAILCIAGTYSNVKELVKEVFNF